GTGQASDPIPPLASWQRPVFLVNSRLALFTATASGFDTLLRHPFSLSYGVILPSSFARVLPSACGYSPRPPVSVTGTVCLATGWRMILEAWYRPVYGAKASPSRFRIALRRSDGFAYQSSLRAWTRPSDRGRCLTFSVPPLLITSPRRNRNIDPLSFAYACRPRLRDRLTLGALTFPP